MGDLLGITPTISFLSSIFHSLPSLLKANMLIKKNTKSLHAQAVLEYVLLVGIISLALFAMMQAIKRGAQSLIRTAADELSVQNSADQSFDIEQGYLDYSNTTTSANNRKQIVERVGVTNYILDEAQQTSVDSKTNMGFTEVEQ